MAFELKKYVAPDFSEDRFAYAPDVVLAPAPRDAVAPDYYHAMGVLPEYFKVDGQWLFAEESRMDCVPVYEDGRIHVREFRLLKEGDLVVTGRTECCEEGIYVHTNGFEEKTRVVENFAFRQGRSRETAFSQDYDDLYELLKYERDHGYIVWVMGPAFTFNGFSRDAFAKIVNAGYAHAVFAGNAMATHDIEGALFQTSLGQNIHTKENQRNGHYNHIDAINRVKLHGSIEETMDAENITDGIMHALVRNNVPYVLAGSIRDDGPLPEVYADVYEAQNAMRSHVRKATTVICMATMLHTIATGNMTPSYRVLEDGTVRQVYFYCVDISEFAVNKLGDRGSLSSRGIVTNVQDFISNIAKGLGL